MPFILLRDDSFPYLISSNMAPVPTNALQWNLGTLFSVQITSSFIRINKRNVQWFMLGQAASDTSWPYLIDFKHMPSWHVLPCTPVLNALCEVQQDNDMLLFPSTVVDMPLDFKQLRLPHNMQTHLHNVTCSSPSAKRVLNTADTRYEVSLCDLIDTNLEFVLEPQHGLLYWRQVQVSTAWMILSTVLTLYFFTKVCEHMLLVLNRKNAIFSHSTTTLPLCIAVYLMYEHVRVQSYMLLYDEILLHWILLFYVVAQAAYQLFVRVLSAYEDPNCFRMIWNNLAKEDRELFNGVSVSLLLSIQFTLTAQMQCSYDNPFFSILLFIFGIRNALKFFNLIRIHVRKLQGTSTVGIPSHVLKFGHWAADTVVYASLLVLGLRLSSQGPEAYITAVTGQMFMSLLAGAALHAQSHS